MRAKPALELHYGRNKLMEMLIRLYSVVEIQTIPKKFSIGELELLTVVGGLDKFQYFTREEGTPMHRSSSIKTTKKEPLLPSI